MLSCMTVMRRTFSWRTPRLSFFNGSERGSNDGRHVSTCASSLAKPARAVKLREKGLTHAADRHSTDRHNSEATVRSSFVHYCLHPPSVAPRMPASCRLRRSHSIPACCIPSTVSFAIPILQNGNYRFARTASTMRPLCYRQASMPTIAATDAARAATLATTVATVCTTALDSILR